MFQTCLSKYCARQVKWTWGIRPASHLPHRINHYVQKLTWRPFHKTRLSILQERRLHPTIVHQILRLPPNKKKHPKYACWHFSNVQKAPRLPRGQDCPMSCTCHPKRPFRLQNVPIVPCLPHEMDHGAVVKWNLRPRPSRRPHFVQACAFEMHIGMSTESFVREFAMKKPRPRWSTLIKSRPSHLTPTVRTRQCGHTVWGKRINGPLAFNITCSPKRGYNLQGHAQNGRTNLQV